MGELRWKLKLIGRRPQRKAEGSAGSSLAFVGKAGKGTRAAASSLRPLVPDCNLLEAEVTTGWYHEEGPSFSMPLHSSLPFALGPQPLLLSSTSAGYLYWLPMSYSAPPSYSARPLWEDPVPQPPDPWRPATEAGLMTLPLILRWGGGSE